MLVFCSCKSMWVIINMAECVSVEENTSENNRELEAFENEIHQLLYPKEPKATLLRSLSEDNEQSQRDEILALKAIFEDDLCMIDEDTSKFFKIKINPIAETYQDDEVVDLWFCLPIQYPGIPPIFEIEGHGSLSADKADKLYSILMKESCSRLHSTMIYDLINIAQEFVQNVIKEIRDRKHSELSKPQEVESISETIKPDSSAEDDKFDLYDARKYIGHLHNILLKVPSNLKVQSVEDIMRPNLVKKFNTAWNEMRIKYETKSTEFPDHFITEPIVAFHGTPRGNVPNIVRKGLLVPGKESGIRVANGTAYGVGVYLSPYPEYSFRYCNGGTVLVCAVLQGHILDHASLRSDGMPDPFDCIFAYDKMVIYNASHVLPCYVINLVCDYSPVSVDEKARLEKARETKNERLTRITAQGRKLLPYGFGPSADNKLVIEDAAESSEEDDDWLLMNQNYVPESYEYKKCR